jgi:glycosyltransferase involved in cell wall biosynthesis
VKVLFDHPDPFLLAHGGFQTQIEQTRLVLIQAGVEVEFLQWWDAGQRGDIIHFFGRPPSNYIRLAHGKGMKVVMAELLTATGSRSARSLAGQKYLTQLYRRFMPATFTTRMAWDSYLLADACIALTSWEAHLMHYLFQTPRERIHVLPNGVEEAFFKTASAPRGQWLVCTATIAPRKRVLELAQAAVQAKTPLWIIGKPYADSEPYAREFVQLAAQHPKILRYEGPIQDRELLAEAYRSARGFVLLSAMETRSISAEEAAACRCPLLLSDLPWARHVFNEAASYCAIDSISATAAKLRWFYDAAPSLPVPPAPHSWGDVGERLKQIYQKLLAQK